MWLRKSESITLLPDGFRIRSGKKQWDVRWHDVVRVTAFNYNQLSMDLLCLEFTEASGQVLVVNEDIPGYAQLEDALVAQLPGLKPRWRPLVVPPPFAANETVIFEHASHDSGDSAS
jgi:hypothetical protein